MVNHLFVYGCSSPTEGADQLGGRTLIPNNNFTLVGIPPGCYFFHATSLSGTEWRDRTGVNMTAGETFTWTLTD